MLTSQFRIERLTYFTSARRVMTTFAPRGGVVRLLLILAALPVWAGDNGPDEIVRRLIEADHRNRELASQYTYVEEADFFRFDKNRQPAKERSETHQIVFVRGKAYKKLVARNGSPLKAKEEARESQKLRWFAENEPGRLRS